MPSHLLWWWFWRKITWQEISQMSKGLNSLKIWLQGHASNKTNLNHHKSPTTRWSSCGFFLSILLLKSSSKTMIENFYKKLLKSLISSVGKRLQESCLCCSTIWRRIHFAKIRWPKWTLFLSLLSFKIVTGLTKISQKVLRSFGPSSMKTNKLSVQLKNGKSKF